MSAMNEKVSAGMEPEPMPLPNGPAAAAILAGGIGSAIYGLAVVGVEASKGFKTFLTFSKPVGPLSGKTTLGTVAFFAAWVILGMMWKGKDVDLDKVWKIALGLLILGLILTFPPVFEAFAP